MSLTQQYSVSVIIRRRNN